MNMTIHNWIAAICFFGFFLFGAFQGYNEDKMQPAVYIITFLLITCGFGFGASIRGFVDLCIR
jgi:hypothetical protein